MILSQSLKKLACIASCNHATWLCFRAAHQVKTFVAMCLRIGRDDNVTFTSRVKKNFTSIPMFVDIWFRVVPYNPKRMKQSSVILIRTDGCVFNIWQLFHNHKNFQTLTQHLVVLFHLETICCKPGRALVFPLQSSSNTICFVHTVFYRRRGWMRLWPSCSRNIVLAHSPLREYNTFPFHGTQTVS